MEKEEKEKKAQRAPKWSWYVVIGFFIFLLIFTGVKSCKERNDKETKQSSLSEKESASESLPDYFEKDYVLSKGQTIRVPVPLGYEFEGSGHGTKYYLQPKGQAKTLVGGGLPHKKTGAYVSYYDISFYMELANITCSFNKKK